MEMQTILNKSTPQKLQIGDALARDFDYHTARFRTRFEATQISERACKEKTLEKIARRQFIQLSAVAATGLVLRPSADAQAQGMPKIEESDPVAQSLKYVHDASTVDPASRANPAAEQDCANCALIQGAEGDEWRPCQIFPGKLVNAKGWCSVWAPKA